MSELWPEQTSDDLDIGWGDEQADDDATAAWYEQQRPPHHGD
jgi:hypothetical protein